MDTCTNCYPNTASHYHSLLILVIAWVLLFPGIAQTEAPVPAEGPPAELPREALLAGWESTYGSINSMEVEYSHKLVEYKVPDDRKASRLSFAENFAVRLLRDGIRVRSLSSPSPEGFDDSSSIRGYSFDGSITMKYGPAPARKGQITPGFEEGGAGNTMLSYLRLRKYPRTIEKTHPSWADKYVLLTELRDYKHGGAFFPGVRVRPAQEQVAGEWCHVLELPYTDLGPGAGVRIWIAAGKGMLIMRYENTMSGRSRTMEVQEVANINTDVGDIWYPTLASSGSSYLAGGYVRRYQLDVHKFVPHVKPSADEFRLVFPMDTRVYDQVLNAVYVVTADGRTQFYDMTKGSKGKPLDSTEYDERRDAKKPGLSKLLSIPSAQVLAQDSSAAQKKIKLKIIYFGHPGSERERAFVDFLRKHFTEVRQADLATFGGRRVPGADVVILDYDGDYFATSKIKPPRVSFRTNYDQPTVTLGVFGAMISNSLKTGYL